MSTYLEIQVFPMCQDPNPHANKGDHCLAEEAGQAEFYDGSICRRDSDTHEIIDDVEEVDHLTRAQAVLWWEEAQDAHPEASAEWHVDEPMSDALLTLMVALAGQQQAADADTVTSPHT